MSSGGGRDEAAEPKTINPLTLAFVDGDLETAYDDYSFANYVERLRPLAVIATVIYASASFAALGGAWWWSHAVAGLGNTLFFVVFLAVSFVAPRVLDRHHRVISELMVVGPVLWVCAVMVEQATTNPPSYTTDIESMLRIALDVVLGNALLFHFNFAPFRTVFLWGTVMTSVGTWALMYLGTDGSVLVFVMGSFVFQVRVRRVTEIALRRLFLLVRQRGAAEDVPITNMGSLIQAFSRRGGNRAGGGQVAPAPWLIKRADLDFQRVLGRGSFGDVQLASWKGSQLVAVKSLHSATSDSLAEAGFMADLRHPNIVLFVGVCIEAEGGPLLVVEFMDRGSLFDLLHRHRAAMSLRSRVHALAQAASGLAYLHALDPPVVHADVKSANVLLDERGNTKISDFGLTALAGQTRTNRGTLLYSPPESLSIDDSAAAFETTADVYSLGILIWEVLAGQLPYLEVQGDCGVGAVLMMIVGGLRPELGALPPLLPALEALITACWDARPERRPTAALVQRTLNEQLGGLREDSPASGTTHLAPSVLSQAGGAMAVGVLEIANRADMWDKDPQSTKRVLRDTVHPAVLASLDPHGWVVASSPGVFHVGFARPLRALEWALSVATLLPTAVVALGYCAEPDSAAIQATGETLEYAQLGNVVLDEQFVAATGLSQGELEERVSGAGMHVSAVVDGSLMVIYQRAAPGLGERQEGCPRKPEWDLTDKGLEGGPPWRLGKAVVAVKIVDLVDDRDQLAFAEQAALLVRSPHPNVVPLVGAMFLGRRSGLYAWSWQDESLASFLKGNGDALEPAARTALCVGILRGLDFLHRNLDMIHQRLSPQNVLVGRNGVARLGDMLPAKLRTLEMTQTRMHALGVVPAPEVARGNAPTPESDVFQATLVLFEVLTGARPFGERWIDARLIGDVTRGLRPLVPAHLAPPLGELLERGWAPEPTARAPVAEMLGVLEGV